MTTYKNKHGKIELPWATDAAGVPNEREIHTREYWPIAQAWNGRDLSGSITFEHAVGIVNTILGHTDPSTKLASVSFVLKDNLIIHGSKRMKEKHDRLHKNEEPSPPCKMIVL